MFKNRLVKVKRSSYDIGYMGMKNEGKTLTMATNLFMLYLVGYKIFSNFHLNFPHIRIKDYKKLNEIYNLPVNQLKVLGYDDIDKDFSSKFTKKSVSEEINQFILNLGKINCSLHYSVKRSMGVLIDIRESSTNEFWFPKKIRNYYCTDEKYDNIMAQYINNYKIINFRFDSDLEELNPIELSGLENLINLYDTQEIIGSTIKDDIFQ